MQQGTPICNTGLLSTVMMLYIATPGLNYFISNSFILECLPSRAPKHSLPDFPLPTLQLLRLLGQLLFSCKILTCSWPFFLFNQHSAGMILYIQGLDFKPFMNDSQIMPPGFRAAF